MYRATNIFRRIFYREGPKPLPFDSAVRGDHVEHLFSEIGQRLAELWPKHSSVVTSNFQKIGVEMGLNFVNQKVENF